MTIGQPIFDWPDSSIYGRDCSNYTQGPQPIKVVAFGLYNAGAFGLNAVLTPLGLMPLLGDWAVYAVADLASHNLGTAGCEFNADAGNLNHAPLLVYAGRIASVTGNGLVSVNTGVNTDKLQLYAARFVAGRLRLSINGTVLLDVSGLPAVTFGGHLPASLTVPQPNAPGVALAELQVYDQTLSDAGDAAITAGLRASYGL